MVEVTKADRDAAARLNGYANWKIFELCPQHDEDWMKLCARDFAIHREAAARLGIIEGRRQAFEEALEALNDDEVAEAMDCNKVEKYAVHKSAINLAKEAIRALIEESKG